MSDLFQTFPPAFLEAIGVIGFGLYVLNYTLLTMHHLTSHSKTYFAINIIAASCVLIGLTQSFNLASALIQGFWIVISITAIVMRLRPTTNGPSPA
jgi:hypothetical protein